MHDSLGSISRFLKLMLKDQAVSFCKFYLMFASHGLSEDINSALMELLWAMRLAGNGGDFQNSDLVHILSFLGLVGCCFVSEAEMSGYENWSFAKLII